MAVGAGWRLLFHSTPSQPAAAAPSRCPGRAGRTLPVWTTRRLKGHISQLLLAVCMVVVAPTWHEPVHTHLYAAGTVVCRAALHITAHLAGSAQVCPRTTVGRYAPCISSSSMS